MSEKSEFDWVKARSECSVAHVFSELCLGAENDVAAMKLISRDAPFSVLASTHGDHFAVFQAGNVNKKVTFALGRDRIEITNQKGKFTVMLTLNNEGKCRLKVNGGEELEQWQVRRTMLEDLFFGDLQTS